MITLSFDFSSVLVGLLYIIAGIFAYLVLRTIFRYLRRIFSGTVLHGLDRKGIEARWAQIEAMAKNPNTMELKLAVLEADKLLDFALKAMAIPGLTLGDRLKFSAYKYPKINDVWWAHRLRNQIVHESSFYMDPAMARKAVEQYRKTLQMLNLL